MIYFVTGATGFLGHRLTEVLREQGETVIGFGRNASAGVKLSRLGAIFVQGDLTDHTLLMKAIPQNAVIIHCGALSSAWGKYEEFYQANVVGTENVLDVAMKKNSKIVVHISTPSIYVEAKSKTDIRETDPLPEKRINHYAETKWLAELAVDRAHQQGLPVITLRPQGIIGPGDPSILPRLIRVAKKGFVPVIGDEKVSIDLTYVDNVVEAIRLAVKAPPEAYGMKFNITNGESIEQLPMMKWMFKQLGYEVSEKHLTLKKAMTVASAMESAYRLLPLRGEPLLTQYSVCTLGFTRTLNIDSAKKILGYHPIVSLKKGLEKTAQWFQQSTS